MLTNLTIGVWFGGLAFLFSFGGVVIDETTHVSLGSAAAVGAVAVSLGFWISSRLQKIDDRLDEGKGRFDDLEDQLRNIKKRLDSLPCDGDPKKACK
jgi:hypothetical protein